MHPIAALTICLKANLLIILPHFPLKNYHSTVPTTLVPSSRFCVFLSGNVSLLSCIGYINRSKHGGSSMDILDKVRAYREEENRLRWEGTFGEYLEILKERPYVAQSAHSRVYNMIKDKGITEGNGRKTYHFFSNDIFGLEDAIERLVEEYFHPAAKRLDVRKRILLLMGPVSGGKSTIVTMLKRGLEQYSRKIGRASCRERM